MGEKKSGLSVAAMIIGAVVLLCCLSGVGLGAVGFVSFQSYIVRSKTSEATSQLSSLFYASAAYYETEQWGDRSILAEPAPAASACTVGPAISSNTPGADKTILDWSQESESFRAIAFSPYDPMYYQYEIAGPPGRCGNEAYTDVYSFRAHGDLDGDSERSLFELTVRSNSANVLERNGTVRIENEEE